MFVGKKHVDVRNMLLERDLLDCCVVFLCFSFFCLLGILNVGVVAL